MSSESCKIMNPCDFQNYLFFKGLLHDCHIASIRHDSISRQVDMNLQDVDASFAGLPEYSGVLPCRISFVGASLATSLMTEENMRIFEAEVSLPNEENLQPSLLITLWPEGRIKIAFNVAWVFEGALSR